MRINANLLRIAQARTGTGKTLAFLTPIVHNILSKDASLASPPRSRYGGREPDIRAVVISPTRELADQIANEARRLVANTALGVQTAVGGTRKREGLENIMTRGCHLLVGTPGRLKDIFSEQKLLGLDLSKVNTVVFDEADRLLDDGFLTDMQEILSYLPAKEKRQNMLFSATVSREVLDLANTMLNPNFRFVQTIQAGEAQTHEKIPQKVVLLNGLENQLPALLNLIRNVESSASSDVPFKALVFLNTTAEVALFSKLFEQMRANRAGAAGGPLATYEIHSQLTQAQRTRNADAFRRATRGILFTSDVSARGMDYPGVSHVVQLGLPRSRDFYIHRIGRTGRGEKKGEAWLMLAPFELDDAYKLLRKLPLQEDDSLEAAKADLEQESELSPEVQDVLELSRQAFHATDPMRKMDAQRTVRNYFSWVNAAELGPFLQRAAEVVWSKDPQTPFTQRATAYGDRSSGGGFGFRSRDGDRSRGGFNRPRFERRSESAPPFSGRGFSQRDDRRREFS